MVFRPRNNHATSYLQNSQLALEEPGSAGPGLAGAHPALIAARDDDFETQRALVHVRVRVQLIGHARNDM